MSGQDLCVLISCFLALHLPSPGFAAVFKELGRGRSEVKSGEPDNCSPRI